MKIPQVGKKNPLWFLFFFHCFASLFPLFPIILTLFPVSHLLLVFNSTVAVVSNQHKSLHTDLTKNKVAEIRSGQGYAFYFIFIFFLNASHTNCLQLIRASNNFALLRTVCKNDFRSHSVFSASLKHIFQRLYLSLKDFCVFLGRSIFFNPKSILFFILSLYNNIFF